MGDTSIEWCHKSWNPVTGCTKVSDGCRNCFAEAVANRFWGKQRVAVDPGVPSPPPDYEFEYRSRRFTDVQCHPDRLTEKGKSPLHWRKPRRVFVNSMSDLFHDDVPDDFIDRVFAVMALSPQHTFQVLTKREDRMHDYLTSAFRAGDEIAEAIRSINRSRMDDSEYWAADHDVPAWPLPNVHLYVSIENQETADKRIPILLETPAAVRGVSYEPALAGADLYSWLDPTALDACPNCNREAALYLSSEDVEALQWSESGDALCSCGYACGVSGGLARLDHVIVGGESGPKARPCDIAWIRSVVEQCKAAGVPVFVKQLGAQPVDDDPDLGRFYLRSEEGGVTDFKGGDMSEWPEDLRVRELPA